MYWDIIMIIQTFYWQIINLIELKQMLYLILLLAQILKIYFISFA